MLAVVEQSPRAVAAGDKQAWLAMFSELAIIEDPVGSAPHISSIYDVKSGRRNNDVLSRFYDAFIQGNRIEFILEQDFVVGNKVLRDLALRLEVNGMQAMVPMHILYELVSERGELKIQRLAAHWEFYPMSLQMMKSNIKGMLGYSNRLTRGLGFSGIMGFMRAVRSVGDKGKASVQEFVESNNSTHSGGLESLFDYGAVLYFGDGASESPEEFLSRKLDLTASKLIAAGNCVSCSLQIQEGTHVYPAAALFEFNWRSRKIDNVRFFSNPVDA